MPHKHNGQLLRKREPFLQIRASCAEQSRYIFPGEGSLHAGKYCLLHLLWLAAESARDLLSEGFRLTKGDDIYIGVEYCSC